MAIEDLDNFEIEYLNFYSEIPGIKQYDRVDEKRDYIDGINTDITDLHDSADSTGLSDQQVNQLAQDQFTDAGVKGSDRSRNQDITLFGENL
ncbi:MAG: hypothetical protein ABIS59_01735 [Candidatus Saccharibacteria bacterium]